MIRLLHLSDPHFGTEQPEVMAALLAFAAERRPDLTLLTGDITQRARRAVPPRQGLCRSTAGPGTLGAGQP